MPTDPIYSLFQTLQQMGQQSQPTEALKVLSILMQNKDKDFVKRALYPTQSPVYDFGDGRTGTHFMSWATINDEKGTPQHIVYPNIVRMAPNLGLTKLEGNHALQYAIKSNEYIPFNDPAQADWFSKNYKAIWKYGK